MTNRSTRRAALLAAGIVGSSALVAARPARAHGPPAAALQVVAAAEEGPTVVRLTEGLALRMGRRWVYVCPALFGSEDVPRALSADGQLTWVASPFGIYTLDEAGRVQERTLPNGVDGPIIALGRVQGAVVGLRFSTDGVDVLRLEVGGSQVLFHTDSVWPLFAASEDRMFLARAEAATLTVLTLAPDGRELSDVAVPHPADSVLVGLRSAGGEPYPLFSAPSGYALFRVRDAALESVLASDSAIYGPAQAGGGALLCSGTEITQLTPVGPVTSAAPLPLTGIDGWGGDAYACTQAGVVSLSSGAFGGAEMELEALEAPAATDGDLLGDASCRDDWLLFRTDLENAGIRPPDDAGVTGGASAGDRGEGRGCGCGLRATRSSPTAEATLAVYMWLIVLRRPRRARGRRATASLGGALPL